MKTDLKVMRQARVRCLWLSVQSAQVYMYTPPSKSFLYESGLRRVKIKQASMIDTSHSLQPARESVSPFLCHLSSVIHIHTTATRDIRYHLRGPSHQMRLLRVVAVLAPALLLLRLFLCS